MPFAAEPAQPAAPEDRGWIAWKGFQEVRHTIMRVIAAHLRLGAAASWQGLNFDFTGVRFDGGDFRGAVFSGGEVRFVGAEFSGGLLDFADPVFSGGRVYFGGAKFSGPVSFVGAEFSGGEVSFRGAEFSGGVVNFSGAKFSGGLVDFSNVAAWSQPPIFDFGSSPPPEVSLPRSP
jgi:uncharacterized protein YjbI with pentapeptide repeats